MNQTELSELMTQSAQDAVSISQQDFNIILDFSASSVAKVDDVITEYLVKYKEQALEDKAIFTICNVFGAYVGECFIKICGGVWYFDDSNPDAPSIFLKLGENTYAFAGICYEQLIRRSSISVNEYFQNAISQHR